jgi:hypothetical protein
MYIKIDNTGLHVAGRCLEREGKGELDISGLLQLATYIVFCDKIIITDYEIDEAKIRSLDVISKLISLGLPKDVIQVESPEPFYYWRSCDNSAEEISQYLLNRVEHCSAKSTDMFLGFELMEGGPKQLFDFLYGDISESYLRPFLDSVGKIVWQEQDSKNLDEIIDEAKKRKAGGIWNYVLASSDRLRSALKHVKDRVGWSDVDTILLEIWLRDIVSKELTTTWLNKQYGKYIVQAPAVSRARLLSRTQNLFFAKLSDEISVCIPELIRKSLVSGLPSVVWLLAEKGRGEPRAIIEEAINLRSQSKYIRKKLVKICNRKDALSRQNIIDKELAALLKDFKDKYSESRLSMPSLSWDSLVLTLFGYDPVATTAAFITLYGSRWAANALRKHRFSVLSELSSLSLDGTVSKDIYHKLHDNCLDR